MPPMRRSQSKLVEEGMEEVTFRPRGTSWLKRSQKAWRRYEKPVNILMQQALVLISWLCFLATLPFSLLPAFKIAKEYERAVIFRIGRLKKGGVKGPGVFFILPCIENCRIMDLRILSFDVPPQEILSKDSVTVSVDAVVYFQILDPITAITNVNDVESSTKMLAQTTLRNVLGTKSLAQMLRERDPISQSIEKMLENGTAPWGVKVVRVEVKDIRLPPNLLRVMAAEAQATREASARLIHARGEERAALQMVEAAEILGGHPLAITLRYFQAIRACAAEKKSTVIFPLPTNLPNWKLKEFDEMKDTAPTRDLLENLATSFQEGDTML